MIEIFVMIGFVKKIAARAREKGQSAGLFGFLLVAFWVVGEFVGAAIGAGASAAGGGEPQMPLVYGLALVGAAFGAMSAFGLLGLTQDHGKAGAPRPQTFELAADSTVAAR